MVLNMDDYIKALFMGKEKEKNLPNVGNVPTAILKKFPLFKWEEIGKGIEAMKFYEDDKVILFLTRMKKGASFGPHEHEDAEEFCHMIYGMLADRMTNEIKVKGEIMRYGKGLPHEPYARSNNLFTVAFYL